MRCDYDYVQWQVLQTIKNSFTFLPLILLLFSHTATVGQQCGNEEPIASLYVSLEEMPQYAILAEFSVSDSTKVYFSQGNLQYQAKKI